jgi:hypothetical protein
MPISVQVALCDTNRTMKLAEYDDLILSFHQVTEVAVNLATLSHFGGCWVYCPLVPMTAHVFASCLYQVPWLRGSSFAKHQKPRQSLHAPKRGVFNPPRTGREAVVYGYLFTGAHTYTRARAQCIRRGMRIKFMTWCAQVCKTVKCFASHVELNHSSLG